MRYVSNTFIGNVVVVKHTPTDDYILYVIAAKGFFFKELSFNSDADREDVFQQMKQHYMEGLIWIGE